MLIRASIDRLESDLEELGRIGRDAAGGISRPSFSSADLEARAWLRAKIEAAGLAYRQDGAGNQFGRLDGRGKTVMAGSHIDTVLNGGMFDGAAGVLAALECLRTIRTCKIPVSRPLEIASFTDEEGNLVGDFLGSRAFLGLLDRDEIATGRTAFGPPLADILKNTPFSVETILDAHKTRPELEAYLELHIEQGPLLEEEGVPVGIVERIAGKRYRRCSFIGRAAHAGTTPLELRQDAFLGLADFALKATHHVAARHYGSMVTIGRVVLHPGVFSVVPARADFTFEFRSPDAAELQALETELFAIASDTASSRGLGFASREVDKTTPVEAAPRLVGMMEEECRALGLPSMKMTSGAGHDAQILAAACDVGMIFIPCADGISHSPAEKIGWGDLEKGANLLLRTLARLAA